MVKSDYGYEYDIRRRPNLLHLKPLHAPELTVRRSHPEFVATLDHVGAQVFQVGLALVCHSNLVHWHRLKHERLQTGSLTEGGPNTDQVWNQVKKKFSRFFGPNYSGAI